MDKDISQAKIRPSFDDRIFACPVSTFTHWSIFVPLSENPYTIRVSGPHNNLSIWKFVNHLLCKEKAESLDFAGETAISGLN